MFRCFAEQDFVAYFVMTNHMTCQIKMPLFHDGGDPWEGAVQFVVDRVVAPWHVLSFLQHSCVGAIFYCLCL